MQLGINPTGDIWGATVRTLSQTLYKYWTDGFSQVSNQYNVNNVIGDYQVLVLGSFTYDILFKLSIGVKTAAAGDLLSLFMTDSFNNYFGERTYTFDTNNFQIKLGMFDEVYLPKNMSLYIYFHNVANVAKVISYAYSSYIVR